MSLELSGTTGVKGVAGSVSAPSIVGDDTNTGISFPAADTIKFSTGGVERMSITNSGVSATGHIIQVVSTTKTDSTSTSTSGSFADISGMSVSITPSSTSSKILILISLGSISSSPGVSVGFKLIRGSTAVGNAASSSLQSGFTNIYGGEDSADKYLQSASHNFLDSPSTTSSTTYKLQWRNSSGTTYLNAYYDGGTNYSGSSTITAMEVAG